MPEVGAVVVLPIGDESRDAGEVDRHLLVLATLEDEATVLVLGGRILGKTAGQVATLHGLISLLRPL